MRVKRPNFSKKKCEKNLENGKIKEANSLRDEFYNLWTEVHCID